LKQLAEIVYFKIPNYHKTGRATETTSNTWQHITLVLEAGVCQPPTSSQLPDLANRYLL